MLSLAWYGSVQLVCKRIETQRWLLWVIFLSFPVGFIATLTGWFVAEVGRQPWTVYGVLRTADAVTPFLTSPEVATTLAMFVVVYGVIFTFGTVLHLPDSQARTDGDAPTASWADQSQAASLHPWR